MNFNKISGQKGKSNIILGAVVLGLGLIFLFFIARSIFTLLSYIAPFLLILSLIINYKVVLNYLKSIWTNLNNNFLFGILMVLFTVIGFPIVSAYLLFKSIIYRRVDLLEKESRKRNETFTDYEDISNESDFMELKEIDELKKSDSEKNEYENLF